MAKYKKKPVVIEAMQYNGEADTKGLCPDNSCTNPVLPHVHTIHNNSIIVIRKGDFIIPEPNGKHFYPCKPDIFEQTYEKVE